uniref:Predicted nucleic acid-binding protein, contains PIN domain n=1 Tax=Candidatus Kentrum sp. DK TaxID=2126562 RepID=A0A450S5P8_9GAMM|nr:MAG: Predicted nucleic acid-binding protein, contains PIN domain [Candidatus Kentron sp. DK]VFJ58417.1 MAG: Predicted nucleic acid-binding protein, contains PIN domain [Candidatus Kentron sp. DK]
MSAEYFFDTNIFVYQFERSDLRKAAIAEELIKKGIADGSVCISFQVVQECLNTMLRKAKNVSASTDELENYLRSVLIPLCRIQPSRSLYLDALSIRSRYRFDFYDSLIIAAALAADCRILYTEDLQHGQRIGKLTIENPFHKLQGPMVT